MVATTIQRFLTQAVFGKTDSGPSKTAFTPCQNKTAAPKVRRPETQPDQDFLVFNNGRRTAGTIATIRCGNHSDYDRTNKAKTDQSRSIKPTTSNENIV